MIKDNRIVVDLNKVQYARFYYRNQYNQTIDKLIKDSKSFTIRLTRYDKDELAMAHNDHPLETCYQRAKRLGQVDVWTPEIKLQLQANHSLIYTGAKAKSLWDAWCKRQFKKK